GLMELDAANTYTGTTTLDQGTLQVDGSIGNVVATGGTLQGVGTVGTINATGTVVAPGDSPGILNSGSVTWDGTRPFPVELAGTTLGTQYDQLSVPGAVELGGANLDVQIVSPFVPATGSQYTIIQRSGAGRINGQFVQGTVFFVNGIKF